jgi:hypothetical protein
MLKPKVKFRPTYMSFNKAKRLKKTYITYMLKPKVKSHPTYMPFTPAKRLKKTYITYMLKKTTQPTKPNPHNPKHLKKTSKKHSKNLAQPKRSTTFAPAIKVNDKL